jgi:hypothetical protein
MAGPRTNFCMVGPHTNFVYALCVHRFVWRTPCGAALCAQAGPQPAGCIVAYACAKKSLKNRRLRRPLHRHAPRRSVRVTPPISELQADLRGSLIFLSTVKSSCAGHSETDPAVVTVPHMVLLARQAAAVALAGAGVALLACAGARGCAHGERSPPPQPVAAAPEPEPQLEARPAEEAGAADPAAAIAEGRRVYVRGLAKAVRPESVIEVRCAAPAERAACCALAAATCDCAVCCCMPCATVCCVIVSCLPVSQCVSVAVLPDPLDACRVSHGHIAYIHMESFRRRLVYFIYSEYPYTIDVLRGVWMTLRSMAMPWQLFAAVAPGCTIERNPRNRGCGWVRLT